MSALVLNLRIAGALLLGLACAHVHICQRFQWRQEAGRLSPFNRQVLLVHAFFIALTVGLMGALASFWPAALVARSPLGLPVTAGLSLFWTVRLFVQLFVYDSALWKGKRFESAAHVLFTLFWLYLTLLFGWCARLQLAAF